MSDTPKLLTEAEAEFICNKTPLEGIRILRERGLIAPELDAIDRLRDALADIHGIHLDREKMERVFRKARMELRPELTREMVGQAVLDARETLGWAYTTDSFVTALHTALTEARDA